MVHTFYTSSWEAELGGYLSSQVYPEKHCLEKKTKNKVCTNYNSKRPDHLFKFFGGFMLINYIILQEDG